MNGGERHSNLAHFRSFSVVGCVPRHTAEPIKADPAKTESVKAEPKKSESKQPEMKTVCKPMKDNSGKVLKDKQGKDREQCKTIKVHKKHEGKPANVEEQKK